MSHVKLYCVDTLLLIQSCILANCSDASPICKGVWKGYCFLKWTLWACLQAGRHSFSLVELGRAHSKLYQRLDITGCWREDSKKIPLHKSLWEDITAGPPALRWTSVPSLCCSITADFIRLKTSCGSWLAQWQGRMSLKAWCSSKKMCFAFTSQYYCLPAPITICGGGRRRWP